MPPHVPRKRLREDYPDRSEVIPKKKNKTEAPAVAPPRKATLFDDLDAAASPKTKGKVRQKLVESSDDSSSLRSLSDADFEDVPAAKSTGRQLKAAEDEEEEEDQADEEDDEEDIEFEDVSYSTTLAPQQAAGLKNGALELTLSHIPTASYTDFGGKRGPSKNERRIRAATHCMHVQFLMWHNALRNTWLCDPTVQGIMLSHLPPGMWDEIERFRRNSGLQPPGDTLKKVTKGGSKDKAKGKSKTAAAKSSRRDWGDAAERLETGAVDLSFGDPLFRLLKALSNWWRKRFRTTAPGVRKIGYMQTRRSTNLIKGYRAGGTNPKRYGERISNLEWFRLRAQECAGSRDVGAQLFTALLRAIGLEARMVANLQPAGFGFNKLEEAEPEKQGEDSEAETPAQPNGRAGTAKEKASKSSKQSEKKPSGQQSRRPGRSLRPKGRADLKDDSDDAQDDDLGLSESNDDSIIEIPPLKNPRSTKTSKFDKDLEYPHYWTEVLSPATHKYVPVDAIVRNVIGTNRELTESLEPRGAKADKAKQVMAYVVGFSDDGTAKDVTVRYLKQQILPGRTKGMRLPVEKIPVYNKNGKVKRYDQFDWFKSIIRGYARGGEKHPLTDIDWDEELTDLKAAQPQQKEVKEGEETLQYYKQSTEFVLARHLKREEALLPTATPVKVFKNKGKKGKGEEEEPVFLRKDVVQVKSEETWHKQGRAPLAGVEPLKMAPYRVATTNRRRELAEAEALAGHKVLQPLYSYDQTDWIIPPPIENGVIPKNQYGNIDLFAEHMLPEGAAHVPYRGAVRVCKRLGIDFAEAVVDFEFGHRMAVPVIHGVVVPEEHHDSVMEELAKDEAEKKRKEDEKRRKVVLTTWKRFLMGLRIRERIRREYGDADGSYNVFGHSRDPPEAQAEEVNKEEEEQEEEETAGGFLPGGFEEQDEADHGAAKMSSFFFPANDDEDGDDADDGHLIVEHGEASAAGTWTLPTPMSATRGDEDRPATRRQRARRRAAELSSDEDGQSGDGVESEDTDPGDENEE